MHPESGGSITDLKLLDDFIKKHGLDYVIGQTTKADGSCYLWALKQNMEFFQRKGTWRKNIPEDVEMLRLEIVGDMVKNKKFWTEPRFNPDINRYSDPPLTDEMFQNLIEDQEKERAYTDNQGLFVLASCLYLDIELHVLNCGISGSIDKGGIRGPLQIINKAKENEHRVVFHVGLLKDRQHLSGHYQFIFKSELNNNLPVPRLGSPTQRLGSTLPRSSISSPQSPSPLKITRSLLIRKYLKSPSAKTKKKEDHCFFCNFVGTGSELESHLAQSSSCQKYYKRNYKTNDIVAICVREFKCLFCFPKSSIYTINHLKSNAECKRKYFAKFNVQDIKDLKSVLDGYRKMLRPSVVNRKLEMHKAKTKRDEEIKNKTEIDLLNAFRQEITFCNFACCYKCNANFPTGRMEEVNCDDIDANIIQEVLEKRRFQRLFICSMCKERKQSNTKEAQIKMLEIVNDERRVYAPVIDGDVDIPASNNNSDDLASVKIIIPCSVDSLELFESKLRSISPRQSDVGEMYKVGANIRNLVSLSYENELFKYYTVKQFGDCFQGVIGDSQAKTLKSATKVVNDGSVVGSEAWRRQQASDLHHRFEQLGSICVFISVPVPFDSQDVIATSVLQQDQVITVQYKGDSLMELETKYLVHVAHSAGKDCSENCQKIPLSDYLENVGFDSKLLSTRFLSTYISSVVTKMNSLIKNFIKAPSSKLTSEYFYVQLHFEEDGQIQVQGLLWPRFLENLNLQYSKYPDVKFDEKTKDESVKYVESIICASSDEGYLEEEFSLSKMQAKKLSQLVIKNQNNDFQSLPSLKTLILEYSVMNLKVSQQFSEWMKEKLQKLSLEEMSKYSTESWLCEVFGTDEIMVNSDNDQMIKVKTVHGHTFLFEIDERLKSLVQMFQELFPNFENSKLLACYHYSISTAPLMLVGGAVLKRIHLRDSFTREFNVTLLKAFSSETNIRVTNGNSVKDEFKSECAVTSDVGINEKVAMSHQELTFTETLVLFDKKISRSQTSNPVGFIAAYKERKNYFKKVSVETEKSFKIEHAITCQNYEPMLTGVDRFFLMDQGSNIVLTEFIRNYDYAGEKESAEILKLFGRSDVVIQDSEVKSAFSEKSFLKELIFLNNGDVMKLRKSPKVVSYPRFHEGSKEYMFRQVLMFSPEATEDMDDDKVETLFFKKDQPPTLDEDGHPQTIINRIER